MPDLKYNIIQTLAVLPAVGKWHKELNLIEWGDRKAKYDIRGWNKDRSEMTKRNHTVKRRDGIPKKKV